MNENTTRIQRATPRFRLPKLRSIRTRFAIVLLIVIGGFVTGLVETQIILQKKEMEQQFERSAWISHSIFAVQLQEDTDGLAKALSGLVRDEKTLDLFMARDRKGLLDKEAPLFAELKTKYRITHLYFILPDGTVFLRVHKPEQFGDVLQRITYLQAKQSGRPSSGIEMGALFFSLRYVYPVFVDGKLIGYIEAGQEIDHIIKFVKEISGDDVSLWLTNDFIAKKKADIQGFGLDEFTLLSTTAKQDTLTQLGEAGLASWLERGLQQPVYGELQVGKSYYGLSAKPFQDASGAVVGVLVAHRDQTEVHRAFQVRTMAIFASGLVLFLGLIVILNLVTRRSFHLLQQMVKVAEGIARGELNHVLAVNNKDEIGALAASFAQMVSYLKGKAEEANKLAQGNLLSEIDLASEQDTLGLAFSRMTTNLRRTISQVSESVAGIGGASNTLAAIAHQSGQATSRITTSIQQIASGAIQQSQDVNKTSTSLEQMGGAIERVARGAQEQVQTMSMALQATALISAAIEQVVNSAHVGVQGVTKANQVAHTGSQIVEAAMTGTKTLMSKVSLSMEKIREVEKRSEQIDSIVETIEEIAAQTNLLALNAAIEAARVEAKGEKTVEGLLQQHMLGVVNLIAAILASGRELDSKDLVELASLARVEDLCIADPDGVVVKANQPANIGFRFAEDSHQQSSAFRPLLHQRDGIVIRPIMFRDQDGRPYIYVGVSRPDCPGIIQAGTPADIVYGLGGYSRGFAVVAGEVGKLAEHAKASTKEVGLLIRELQKTVKESIVVMEDGAHDAEIGSAQAMQAGRSLANIVEVVESIKQQVTEVATLVQHINTASKELVCAMETVSTTMAENTSATEAMTAQSAKLTQATENIASVSEQNGAAAEEVSASAEEVVAQVQEVSASAASLMSMAHGLQQIVAQFSLLEAE